MFPNMNNNEFDHQGCCSSSSSTSLNGSSLNNNNRETPVVNVVDEQQQSTLLPLVVVNGLVNDQGHNVVVDDRVNSLASSLNNIHLYHHNNSDEFVAQCSSSDYAPNYRTSNGNADRTMRTNRRMSNNHPCATSSPHNQDQLSYSTSLLSQVPRSSNNTNVNFDFPAYSTLVPALGAPSNGNSFDYYPSVPNPRSYHSLDDSNLPNWHYHPVDLARPSYVQASPFDPSSSMPNYLNNNVNLPSLLYPVRWNRQSIVQDDTAIMLEALRDPYHMMTHPPSSESLQKLITKSEKYCNNTGTMIGHFIGNFLTMITRDQRSLVSTACHHHGTHVLQRLIKCCRKHPDIYLLPQALGDYVVYLMTHFSGRHVIQECFIHLEKSAYKHLYDHLKSNYNWYAVATDKNGCISLNVCLNHMADSYKSKLMYDICLFAKTLASDPSGNFVLQHIITMRTPFNQFIVEVVKDQIENLCTTKSASHLVEKCLETPFKEQLVRELLRSGKMLRIATNEYGNYVIQRALEATRGTELYRLLVNKLSRDRAYLQVNKYGKNVANKLPEYRDQHLGTF